MNDDERWERWIRGFRENDARAYQEFWTEYGPVLQQIAEKNLAANLKRRIGAEDIVQSACRTFFRRVQGGQLQLNDGESLWSLLCAITLTKVRMQARYHSRKKRGMQQEVHALPDPDQSGVLGFQPVDRGPSPAQAAEFADQFKQLLEAMDEEERKIIDLKLQDHTHDEIAEQLGMSERTVRRIFKRVQAKLARALEAPAAES